MLCVCAHLQRDSSYQLAVSAPSAETSRCPDARLTPPYVREAERAHFNATAAQTVGGSSNREAERSHFNATATQTVGGSSNRQAGRCAAHFNATATQTCGGSSNKQVHSQAHHSGEGGAISAARRASASAESKSGLGPPSKPPPGPATYRPISWKYDTHRCVVSGSEFEVGPLTPYIHNNSI